MRILYGITANGNGHIARSSRIVRRLRERGHDLELVISGSPGKALLDEADLSPFRRFQGFSFAGSKGSMSVMATILAARPGLFIRNLRHDIPAGDFDLAVTDFEPLVGWYARIHRIPSVGLCHMYAFLYPGVPKPASRWYERLTYRWLAPADMQLGLHWFPYHPMVIPPFVEPVDCSAEDERMVLVYLPWEDSAQYISELAKITSHRFIVYGDRTGHEGGIEFKRHDRSGFMADLGSCATVIANAGFALASEALSHGKRLILKPYARQPEQEHNALLVESLGLGTRVESLHADIIRPLLASGRRSFGPFPDMVPLFVSWLESAPRSMDANTYGRMWGASI